MSSHSAATTGPTSEPALSVRIAAAIADARGVDPQDIEPIHRYVDLEALATLVASGDDDLWVRWSVGTHQVAVDGTGTVHVE